MVNPDNQVADLRAIELETENITSKLDSIVEIITVENIPVNSYYSNGNIISELEDQIKITKPDLIVVGKKKGKRNFMESFLDTFYINAQLIIHY